MLWNAQAQPYWVRGGQCRGLAKFFALRPVQKFHQNFQKRHTLPHSGLVYNLSPQALDVGLALFISVVYIYLHMGNNTQANKLPIWAVKIKALRKRLGETQDEFGKRFKVSQVAVAYWESGQYEPPAMVLIWVMQHD